MVILVAHVCGTGTLLYIIPTAAVYLLTVGQFAVLFLTSIAFQTLLRVSVHFRGETLLIVCLFV